MPFFTLSPYFLLAQTGVITPLITCDKNDTLHRALELFAGAGGRGERIFCVDEARRVTGIISLSDIFAYFSDSKLLGSASELMQQPGVT